ncbi:unnamed protein product [Rhizophagus irregularis]|nr:unnamed protein product [Rhizophagus irregularis]CAB5317494.1 unnamed protein product [Rhizophagus irregularis]
MNYTKNSIARVEEIFSIPYDTSRWDYSQFTNPYEFQWKVGITPFSNWQFVVGVWATYFVTIVSLKYIMSFRAPFSMRYITAIHNLFLCIVSAVMCGYAIIDVIRRYQEHGIGECFCTSDSSLAKGRISYVTYIYYLSKFDELFDTVILVLKKKSIIFLHWYHHAIVILMVWSWLEDSIMYASIGMIANTLVHVFMYYYYFSASLGRSVWFKKYITTGQIVQFTISFILAIPYLYFHFTNNCQLEMTFNLNCRRRLDQLFLYRNVKTSQVLVTIGRHIQGKNLKQIDEALRPFKLRKDHWTPFIAISGFTSYSLVMATNNILLNKIQNRPKSPEYYKMEKRLRIHKDMDLVETSVLGLCQSLQQLVVRKMISEEENNLLKIYWERMAMMDLPKEKLGLDWPKFVQHEKLELKRDRLFMNDEFKRIKKSLAERKDRKDVKFKRSIYDKKKEEKENRVNQANQAGNTSDINQTK